MALSINLPKCQLVSHLASQPINQIMTSVLNDMITILFKPINHHHNGLCNHQSSTFNNPSINLIHFNQSRTRCRSCKESARRRDEEKRKWWRKEEEVTSSMTYQLAFFQLVTLFSVDYFLLIFFGLNGWKTDNKIRLPTLGFPTVPGIWINKQYQEERHL